MIQVFDSWAGHLPKDQYETFAMPYQKKVVEAIKAKHPTTPVIIYMAPDIHSKDGQFLDLLATTGVNCVSLDYTVDFADVRAKMPSHLALQGNLDPKLLRDGPLEKIKEETEKILQVRISASRCVEAPSRRRRDSFPSDEVVGGFFFDFEAIRTESRNHAGRRAQRPHHEPGPRHRGRHAGAAREVLRRHGPGLPGEVEVVG